MNADEAKATGRPFSDLTDDELLAKLQEISDTLANRQNTHRLSREDSRSESGWENQ